MDQQPLQNLNGIKSDKKIRLGTGFGLRNSSQVQRPLSKNYAQFAEQYFPNDAQQTQNIQTFTSTNNNIYARSPSPNVISSQLIQNNEQQQNNQMSSSQTQSGFFKRKINLKMNTVNLKAFINKQQNDNPFVIKTQKNRYIGSHQSSGNIQLNNINLNGGNQNQQGNFFVSQQSLPVQISITNSSNTLSPQGLNNITNSTFQNTINTGMVNNSNFDTRRSLNINSNDQLHKQSLSSLKSSETVSTFNRGKRFSSQIQKNLIKQQSTNEYIDNKITNNQYESKQDNEDIEDNNEDQYGICNHSTTKNTIVNQSHQTESTNATALISQHNQPNQSVNEYYFDVGKVKKQQSLPNSQTFISQSSLHSTIYAKKKFNEAKQYSNQQRQIIFKKQEEEEEENFLELCQTLQQINYE